jgi:hypothetical protein
MWNLTCRTTNNLSDKNTLRIDIFVKNDAPHAWTMEPKHSLSIRDLEGWIVVEYIRGRTRVQCISMLTERGWAPATARRFVDNVLSSSLRPHQHKFGSHNGPLLLIIFGGALIALYGVLTTLLA